MIRFFFLNDDGDVEEFTERVNLAESSVVLTTQAEQGSVATSSLVVDDLAGDWDITGHRWVYVLEDTADPEMVYWGYAADRKVSRMAPMAETARQWTITLNDINTLLARRILVGADCNRPAESDVERLQWLTATTEESFIEDVSLLDTSAPVAMDAVDYRHQYATQIYDDCSQASGKNWYVYPVFDGYDWVVGFWYGFGESTDYSSAIRISNDLDDVDSVVTFAPGRATTLTRDPSRVYAGVSMPYDGGIIYYENATTATRFGHRDTSAPMVNVKTNTKAYNRAQRYLLTINTEEDVIDTSILVPPEQVNDVLPGQRIECKYVHLPGYSDFSWMRVLARTVTFLTPREYGVDLTLSAQPVAVFYPIPGDVVPPDSSLCTIGGYQVPLTGGGNTPMHVTTVPPYLGNSWNDFAQRCYVYPGATYKVHTYGVTFTGTPGTSEVVLTVINNSTILQGDLGSDDPAFYPDHTGFPYLLTERTDTILWPGIPGSGVQTAEALLTSLPWSGHTPLYHEWFVVMTYVSGPDPRYEGLPTCPDPDWTAPT